MNITKQKTKKIRLMPGGHFSSSPAPFRWTKRACPWRWRRMSLGRWRFRSWPRRLRRRRGMTKWRTGRSWSRPSRLGRVERCEVSGGVVVSRPRQMRKNPGEFNSQNPELFPTRRTQTNDSFMFSSTCVSFFGTRSPKNDLFQYDLSFFCEY